MISETVVIMMVLGCGNQLQNCDYIATQSADWRSIATCKEAIPAQIRKYQSAPYPVISAQCVRQDIGKINPEVSGGDQGSHKPQRPIMAIEGGEDFGPGMFDLLRAKAQGAYP